MRSFKTEGIVIRRRNFREADRLVTIFSKKRGKLTIKASGVRKITSRRSSHIELLNYCKFGLYEGHGMPVLTEVESLESFEKIKKDLKKIGVAYHVCELIDGLLPENQQHEDVFLLLQDTLNKIGEEDDLQKVSYDFEIELLKLLGFFKISGYPAKIDTQKLIEDILERRLKAKQILKRL